jgi:hypothetical protein
MARGKKTGGRKRGTEITLETKCSSVFKPLNKPARWPQAKDTIWVPSLFLPREGVMGPGACAHVNDTCPCLASGARALARYATV